MEKSDGELEPTLISPLLTANQLCMMIQEMFFFSSRKVRNTE